MGNLVYVDGGANVTGDDLNTFLQTGGLAPNLRAFIGTTLFNGTPMVVFLAGISAVGDGGQGFFYWNAANLSADDNLNTIAPMGAGSGAWQRISTTPTISVLPIVHKTGNYTVTLEDSGTHFDNSGAGGNVTFSLPSASTEGLHYCFAVLSAFDLIIRPASGEAISMGVLSTTVGGYIESPGPYSSICIECHSSGRWIVSSSIGGWGVH